MLNRSIPIMVASLLFAVVSTAQAQQSEDNSQNQPEVTSDSQFSAGLLYYRDPETGQLGVPPADVMQALQLDERNFSDEGLEVVILPDGTKMIDLQGRYQMSSVIKPGQNGVIHHCTSHPNTLNAVEHASLHQANDEQ